MTYSNQVSGPDEVIAFAVLAPQMSVASGRLLKQKVRRSDEIGVGKHRGSNAVVTVFLSVAAALLSIGILGGAATGLYFRRYMADSVGRSLTIGAGVALGGLLLASLLAFFGYVLNFLEKLLKTRKDRDSPVRGGHLHRLATQTSSLKLLPPSRRRLAGDRVAR